MFLVSKDFSFSAAHVLHGLPEGHPCGRMHGHNYVVRLTFQASELDVRGFALLDYRELEPVKKWIDETLDHRCLNELLIQPTAEHIARTIFFRVQELLPNVAHLLLSVAVSETPKTWATYQP